MGKTAKEPKYAQETIMQALAAINNGMTIYAASKHFGIPKTTLLYKHNGKRPLSGKSGPPTTFTPQEEQILVDWIIQMGKAGFPITKIQLLNSVTELVNILNKDNNFAQGRPGRAWFEGFLRRHNEISLRFTETLQKYRSVVTEEKLRGWFKEITEYFGEGQLINDPKRVFNCDETAIFLTPTGEKVLVKKGSKKINRIVANDSKKNYSVLITANADGMLPPPMVIYPYKRSIPADIVNKYPKTWAIGYSERGWMTSATFYEYIANIFHPWLIKNEIEFPVTLFLDGHSSHFTLPLSQFCKSNKIILIAFLPHSTHILQPMEVVFFHPLKLAWKDVVSKWRMNNCGVKISRAEFAPLLEKALNSINKDSTFKNGFRACGLCPFSADAIDYKSLATGKPEIENQQQQKSIPGNFNNLSEFLHQFESRLEENVKASFVESESNGSWKGEEKFRDMFHYWLQIKNDINLKFK